MTSGITSFLSLWRATKRMLEKLGLKGVCDSWTTGRDVVEKAVWR